MKTRVIRCEDMQGHGVYQHFSFLSDLMLIFPWVLQHNDVYGKHPDPARDGLEGYDKGQWHCGFSCLEQMYSWFTEEQRIDIVSKGFRFVWIETEEPVHYGGHQLLFHRHGAKVIGPVEEVLP